METVSRYFRHADCIEMGDRFAAAIVTVCGGLTFRDLPVNRLIDPRTLISSIAESVNQATDNLRAASAAVVRCETDVSLARSRRDGQADTGYNMLKEVFALVQAAAIRRGRAGGMPSEAVIEAVFPFGTPSAVRYRLADFSLVLAEVVENLDRSSLLTADQLAELVRARELLAETEEAFHQAVAGLDAARDRRATARDQFNRTWSFAKAVIDALVQANDLTDRLPGRLFLDRDRKWRVARTGRQEEYVTTDGNGTDEPGAAVSADGDRETGEPGAGNGKENGEQPLAAHHS